MVPFPYFLLVSFLLIVRISFITLVWIWRNETNNDATKKERRTRIKINTLTIVVGCVRKVYVLLTFKRSISFGMLFWCCLKERQKRDQEASIYFLCRTFCANNLRGNFSQFFLTPANLFSPQNPFTRCFLRRLS